MDLGINGSACAAACVAILRRRGCEDVVDMTDAVVKGGFHGQCWRSCQG